MTEFRNELRIKSICFTVKTTHPHHALEKTMEEVFMGKSEERRSGKERREKSNKRAESIIDFFTPEEDEKRSGKDRRESRKPDVKKKNVPSA